MNSLCFAAMEYNLFLIAICLNNSAKNKLYREYLSLNRSGRCQKIKVESKKYIMKLKLL